MKRTLLARWLISPAVVALLTTGAASAAEVRVMISAGFYGVYSELAPSFERASGHKLITTRGPSMGDSPESIPTRLTRGEAADVVILDGGAADELIKRGLAREGSKVDLARSLIGMVVRTGAAKPDIGTVDAFKGTLLAAKSIAYSDSGSGTYLSTKLFAQLGVADQVMGKSRKIRGPPSGEPVAAVIARGEAEIGFQQVSELIHVPGVTFVGTIPAELQPVTFFAGAITKTAREVEAGNALIRYLASAEAAAVITKAGLYPVAPDDAATVAALDIEYQAAVERNDADTMARILADDFVLVIGSGKTFTKADLLNEARTKQNVYERQEASSRKVRVWGDTAVVTALLSAKGMSAAGKAFEYRLWYSDTYVRTAGGWRYVLGQASLSLPKAQ